MKKLLALLLVTFSPLIMLAQHKQESAQNILRAASQQTKRGNKNVLVIFQASWCGWCHKMDSSLLDKKCKYLFEANYIVAHLDVEESPDKKSLENPGAFKIKKSYLGENAGLPFWVILDGDGKLLADCFIRKKGISPNAAGDNIGCPATENEVAYFIAILKRTSKLSDTDLSIIAKRFSENNPN